MSRQSINWVITDPHFNHDHMLEACGRPVNFKELIIKWLKYYIQPQDILFCLGDLIFRNNKELKSLMENANCKRILVRGNHDKDSLGWYMRNGFDYACDGILTGNVWLSHKPTQSLPDGAEFNVHGHWHNFDFDNSHPEKVIPLWYDTKKYKLLSMEKENYKPVNLLKIIDDMRKLNEERRNSRTVEQSS